MKRRIFSLIFIFSFFILIFGCGGGGGHHSHKSKPQIEKYLTSSKKTLGIKNLALGEKADLFLINFGENEDDQSNTEFPISKVLRDLPIKTFRRAKGIRRLAKTFPNRSERDIGDKEYFYIIDINGYVKEILCEKLYQGTHCMIYVEIKDEKPVVPEDEISKLGSAFEDENPFDPGNPKLSIYERTTDLFGEEWDASGGNDGDYQILIVVCSSDSLGGDNLFGYFNPTDEYYPKGKIGNTDASNQGEIIYINGKYVEGDMYNALATISHEFQHMIDFNQKIARQGTFPDDAKEEKITINEGKSMLSEAENGFSIDTGNYFIYKILDSYLKNYSNTSFFRFNQHDYDYGKAYLFLEYIRERFGEKVIKEISTSKYTGIKAIEDGCKTSFKNTFFNFCLSTYLDCLKGSPENYEFSRINLCGTYYIRGILGEKSGNKTLCGLSPKSCVLPCNFSLYPFSFILLSFDGEGKPFNVTCGPFKRACGIALVHEGSSKNLISK